ncbi:MAG: ribosome maturation factor RimM [Bacteroidota bacterium]
MEGYFELGYFKKTHGIHGQLWLEIDADEPSRYGKLDALFVEQNGSLIPFFVTSIQLKGSQALLSLDEIETVEDAQALKGSVVFLPTTVLPELEEDEMYLHDYVGFTVLEHNKGMLGKIKGIVDLPNNLLIELDYQGKEVLLPLQDQFILKTDKNKQELHMQLPEGLLEVYLEEDK